MNKRSEINIVVDSRCPCCLLAVDWKPLVLEVRKNMCYHCDAHGCNDTRCNFTDTAKTDEFGAAAVTLEQRTKNFLVALYDEYKDVDRTHWHSLHPDDLAALAELVKEIQK